MKTSRENQTAAAEEDVRVEWSGVERRGGGREGGRHRLRGDYSSSFPVGPSIFQIDNEVGLGDQPGDFHTEMCFSSETNGGDDSLTPFLPVS